MTEPSAPIEPARTALLLMDFQLAILPSIPDADALLERTAAAVAAARAAGVRVGHVRVGFTPADRAAIPATNKGFARMIGSEYLSEDAPETDIHPVLAPRDGDIVVRKTRVGAFGTTDLAAELRARDVRTLVLAGIHTSGVVLSTVRDAADRDYRLMVLADACADPDAEVHALLTGQVFPRQAEVLDVADFVARLRGRGVSRPG